MKRYIYPMVLFTDENDSSIVKTVSGDKSSSSTTTNNSSTDSEVTWATFFYIFSSLLLVVTLVIAMVAVFLKKHPIKRKTKVTTENIDLETVAKTKEKILNDQETKQEGGIE